MKYLRGKDGVFERETWSLWEGKMKSLRWGDEVFEKRTLAHI